MKSKLTLIILFLIPHRIPSPKKEGVFSFSNEAFSEIIRYYNNNLLHVKDEGEEKS